MTISLADRINMLRGPFSRSAARGTVDPREDYSAQFSKFRRSASFNPPKNNGIEFLSICNNHGDGSCIRRRSHSDTNVLGMSSSSTNEKSLTTGTINRRAKNPPFCLPYESDTPILYLMDSLRNEEWRSSNDGRCRIAMVHVIGNALNFLGEGSDNDLTVDNGSDKLS